MKSIIFSLSIALFFLVSCKKNVAPEYNASATGQLSVEFDNVAGNQDLQLNTGNYTNASGEAFKVTLLKYFVSNFTLTKTDGSVYSIPQDSCYFLIDESKPASTIPVLRVPEGEYSKLTFMVGVDSLRNTLDISKRIGILDPAGAAAGMYWSWNSGYIFFKMEGTSPASTQNGNIFQYHIGLFGGYTSTSPTLNNIKTITLDLTARGTAKIKATKSANIHLLVDVMKVFNGSPNVSIAQNSVVMVSPFSATIANNYVNMFTHNHTEN
ncbi:MAG: hypothetical protein K2W79_09730 [Hydrotalea flava]|uniref:MbnP family protein n=1 Tax=Hydrotalea sp. TaxID=2881279 RepID=UPI000944F884|nr:MbnP family protein [Hydrotalea sp.]MBY0348529.1 hypothetical protein [Hydrotalea flava]